MSHPEWVRGLKQQDYISEGYATEVAPRVGAWIETKELQTGVLSLLSHPEWVRGLKLGHTSIATTQI